MVKSTDCHYFIDIEDISSPTRLLYLLTWFTWQKVANLKNCLSVVFLCKSKVSNFVLKLLNYYKISSVECLGKWVGIEGQEPGKTGGGRRKGGKQDLLKIAGSRREIQKGKLSLFGTAYHPVKETNPTIVSWLPFNILRGWKQNFVCKKSQEAKIRTRDKKKKQHYFKWMETFPSCLHHRAWMRWNDTCASVSTVSVVSVSPLSH